MMYYRVEMSNGYCGHDDEFLVVTEKEPTGEDLMELYAYSEGGACLSPDDEEFQTDDEDADGYFEAVMDNSSCEEIDEEEFIRLRDEEGWEVWRLFSCLPEIGIMEG